MLEILKKNVLLQEITSGGPCKRSKKSIEKKYVCFELEARSLSLNKLLYIEIERS